MTQPLHLLLLLWTPHLPHPLEQKRVVKLHLELLKKSQYFVKLTRENDWLHLWILPQDPEEKASQVQRVDELSPGRAGAPHHQGLSLL